MGTPTRARPLRARAPRSVTWHGAAAVAIAALLVAACGPKGDAADASPVATSTVHLPPSYRFDPVAITVPAGTTVTWVNDDHFSHSVDLADDPAAPPSMAPGVSVRLTFPTAGRYPYVCSFHPNDMRGVVVVTAS